MMKYIFLVFICFFSLYGNEEAVEERPKTVYDADKLSEAFGNFVGKNLSGPFFKMNLEKVIFGIREGASGHPSPLTEEEYEDMMAEMQERATNEMATTNLAKADSFLKENTKTPGLRILEDGKLQILVLEEGKGAEVQEGATPLVHYTGKYADGAVFGTSQGGAPVPIPLGQTIPGFQKGVVGMKEGEKRRLFVHPDLGYGKTGQLMPNSLLIFDIEVVAANAPQTEEGADDHEGEGEEELEMGEEENP